MTFTNPAQHTGKRHKKPSDPCEVLQKASQAQLLCHIAKEMFMPPNPSGKEVRKKPSSIPPTPGP